MIPIGASSFLKLFSELRTDTDSTYYGENIFGQKIIGTFFDVYEENTFGYMYGYFILVVNLSGDSTSIS